MSPKALKLTQNARGPPWRSFFAPCPWTPCFSGGASPTGRGPRASWWFSLLPLQLQPLGTWTEPRKKQELQGLNNCVEVVTIKKKNRWAGGEWSWQDRMRLSENLVRRATTRGKEHGLRMMENFTWSWAVSRHCSLNGRTPHWFKSWF